MKPVGRDRELAVVEQFGASFSDGPAALVLVGPPGIGKTTLWRAGVEAAEATGALILRIKPSEAEARLAYAAVGDLLAPLVDVIGCLPAPQRRALRVALLLEESRQASLDERTVGVATAALFTAVAASRPLFVAIDDAQWLDSSSATVLGFALRRLVREPVHALIAMRDTSDAVELEVDDVTRLEVGPLPFDATDALLRAQLGKALRRPLLARVFEVSSGNPFYALELGRAALEQADDEASTPRLPRSLTALLTDRLRRVSIQARHVLLVAALARNPSVDLVLAVANAGVAAVEEGVREGLLEPDFETVRFSHPLFAAALQADAAMAAQRRVHRRLAELVSDPEERARHLAAAAAGPDADAAETLEWAAAGARSRGASEAAAELTDLALQLTPRRSPKLSARLRVAAEYHLHAGNLDRAHALLVEARDRSSGSERAHALWELARLASRRGDPGAEATAVELNRQALRDVGDDDVLRARIHKSLAFNLHQGAETVEAERHAETALAIAETVDDPPLLAEALAAVGRIRHWCRAVVDRDSFERAIALEAAGADFDLGDRPRLLYALALLDLNEIERARTLLLELLDACERDGEVDIVSLLLYLAFAELAAAHLDAAHGYADRSRIVAEQTGRDPSAAVVTRARIELLSGATDEARASARQVLEVPALHEWWAAMARGLLAAAELEEDRPSGALRVLGTSGSVEWPGGRERVEAFIRLGRLDEAEAVLEVLEQRPLSRFPWMQVELTLLRAQIDAHGRAALAAAQLEAALPDARSRPLQHAFVLYHLGRVRRSQRQIAAAREALAHAHRLFATVGARVWAERAESELALVPGRRPSPGTLTPIEAQIAELVATGRSNAEVAHELVVSPKTVEWNLSKIYKKLHVRGRAELAAKLARRS